MARDINDRATITLQVNGQQAKKMMQDLAKDIDKAEKNLEKMRKSGADPVSIAQQERNLKRMKKNLAEMQSATKNVADVLRDLDKATPKQLEKSLKTLKKQLKDLQPGTKVWDEHTQKIRELQERLKAVNATIQAQQTTWERAKGLVNKYMLEIGGVIAALSGMMMAGRKAISAYAEIEEQLAETRKYTGMTAEDVLKLNEAFQEMDTRTTRDKLNELAQEAGRLGKNTLESVQGYVEAADIINVALVDLGAGATQTIAKLTNIFGVEQMLGTKEAMLAVGSTVNVLSQNCTASKPYLVEFAQRMAGIGSQAGLTIPQILAFGAVLDANGQKVEMSATAIQKVIMNLANKNKAFAKTLGLDAEKLSATLKVSAKDGLLMFLEALHAIGEKSDYANATMVLAPAFKDMGLDAARVSQVLSTLAKHIDEVKWQMGEADKAFREASSATNEYQIFNSTVQASMDKAKKRVNELAISLGEKLYPVMKHVYTSSGLMLRTTNSLVDFFIQYKRELFTLTTGIVAYELAVKRAIIAETAHKVVLKAKNVLLALSKAAYLAGAAIVDLFAGKVAKANAEFRLMNMTMKSSPLGIVITLITMGATALVHFAKQSGNATDRQKNLSKALSETNTELVNEQNEIDRWFGALKKAKKGTEEYEKAKNHIINQYGQYLSGLINERNELIDIEAAYYRVSRAAREAAISRGMADAKKGVDDKFNETNNAITDELEQNLHKYLKNQQDFGPIMAMIRKDISEKGLLSYDTEKLIRSSIKKGGKVNSFSVIESTIKKMSDNYDQYAQDIKDVEEKFGYTQNEFTGYTMEQLRLMSDDLNDQIKESKKKNAQKGNFELIVSGQIVGEYSTRAQAYLAKDKIEEAIKMKMTEAGAAQSSSSEMEIEPNIGAGKDKESDKFKAEKQWREREEALIRISYATGETDYINYTNKMSQIAIDYYDKILQKSNLTENERLKFTAEKNEAEKAMLETKTKQSVEAENEKYMSLVQEATQYYLEGTYSKKVYDWEIERLEIEHQRNLVALYKDGTKEKAEAERSLQKLLLKDREKRQKETEKEQKEHEAELKKIKDEYFSKSEKERKDEYDKSQKLLDELYKAEISKEGLSYKERIRLTLQYEAAKYALRQKYLDKSKKQDKEGWDSFESFINKMINKGKDGKDWGKIITKAWSQVSGIMSQISELTEAELERQTAAIEKRYDAEINAAEGNKYQIAKLEKQKAQEIAEAKDSASKKQFDMQVIQAVAETAQNAITAWGTGMQAGFPAGPILAPILAGFALASGAIQIATIKKQQQAAASKGYEYGGFTDPVGRKVPAGIVHGGEWVASKMLVDNPTSRPYINALEYAQRNNTVAHLRPDYVSRSISAPAMIEQTAGNNDGLLLVASALSENTKAMRKVGDRLNEPSVTVNTVTGDYGIKRAQDRYNSYMKSAASHRNKLKWK